MKDEDKKSENSKFTPPMMDQLYCGQNINFVDIYLHERFESIDRFVYMI